MRSIRSSSRVRTSKERGFALISALVLAILYFALMELLLIDSMRALQEAQRFRARTVAATLAENGAELAAEQLLNRYNHRVNPTADFQGEASGEMKRGVYTGEFELKGEGKAMGALTQRATVTVQGRIVGQTVKIDYTMHSQ